MAGGVNLTLDVSWSLKCAAARMLAPDGRCKTLDAAADGYVRAEACVTFRIRRRVTIDDGGEGEAVSARARPRAANQDGRSSSLTAPNGPAQTAAIRAAMRSSRAFESDSTIVPSDVASLQMHGTGTALGDPIEIGAAAEALTASATSVTSSLVLGAVKSAVGHAEPAAGAIGLLAATRAMVRRAALAMPHLREMNRHVEAALRSAVRGSSAPFRATAPRRFAAIPSVMDTNRPGDASVSAFAFQGTNAHAIVRCARDDGSRQFVSRRFTVGDASPSCCAVPKPHAWLIRAAIFADEETRARFEVSLADNIDAATLWDHIVRGKALCPAAAFAEMAAQASWFAQRDDSRDDPGEDVGGHRRRLRRRPETARARRSRTRSERVRVRLSRHG